MKFEGEIRGVEWDGKDLTYIDQTLIPSEYKRKSVQGIEDAIQAILQLQVRGAPAIAMFASFTLVLELKKLNATDVGSLKQEAARLSKRLFESRPTAVNLGHAMKEMMNVISAANSTSELISRAQQCAEKIYADDRELCAKLGEFGSTLIPINARIITYCNTGSLATAGIGTAIGAFKTAHSQNKNITVYALETRPLLQGSRLTSWELDASGIKTILATDNMAGHILQREQINLVMVGADRVTSRGDTANKIGTLTLAVAAKHFGVPFYVVAPSTSIDSTISDGLKIEIEERSAAEVRGFGGKNIAPDHINVRNPAFDVTPAELISAVVTEKGVFKAPYQF